MDHHRLTLYCWTLTGVLVSVFIYLHLIKFLVFLLFVYLISDICIHQASKYLPFKNPKLLLFLTYIFISIATTLIVIWVLPQFLVDLPIYIQRFQVLFIQQFSDLFSSYQIDIGLEDLKLNVIGWLKQNIKTTLGLIQKAGLNVFLFVLAVVINFIIWYNRYSSKTADAPVDNFFDYFTSFLLEKISTFYVQFRTIMYAQLIISLINTCLTFIILFALNIPYKMTLLVLVFLFGLLPVLGNIISNTIICSAAFVWSTPLAVLIALAFLVGIHKLEYVLNSKIIGHITALPIYVTIIALIIGELMFHISGMILAVPFVLFFREELTAIKLERTPSG